MWLNLSYMHLVGRSDRKWLEDIRTLLKLICVRRGSGWFLESAQQLKKLWALFLKDKFYNRLSLKFSLFSVVPECVGSHHCCGSFL